MRHTGALVVAALLRCRRRLHAALAQSFEGLSVQKGHTHITTETWQRFELQEMRQGLETMLPVMRAGTFLAAFATLAAFVGDAAAAAFAVVAGVAVFAGVVLAAPPAVARFAAVVTCG